MIRINLMSVREVEREAGRRQEVRLIALGSMLAFALLLMFEVGSRVKFAPILAEHSQLQTELAALDTKTKELTELERQRHELSEKLKTITLLEQRKVGPVRVLSDLSDAIPDRVWLLDFTEDGGAATLTGLALDNQTVATFMRQLAGSPYFTDVDLVEATQSEQEGVPLKKFVVRARLSYSGARLAPAAPGLKYPEPPKEQLPVRPTQPARKGNRV